MPYKAKQTNTKSPMGSPSHTEHSKAETKVLDNEKLEATEEIRMKYTDENEEPDPKVLNISHKNRNLDKPNIDKPAYGGS
ncbi:MAG TPA: hypothetical protein VF691_13735 [Cytophagaceae bacterium]|jgi:hypothetical protein